jgi:hypothetical protein
MIPELVQLLGPAIRTGPLYQIHRMNREPGQRKDYMSVVNRDHTLIGIIVSQPTGKCIGIIDKQGQIKHCDGKDALSPYTVMLKSNVVDKSKSKTTGKEQVLGQCVDVSGVTVAELVRSNKKNSIRPAKKSKARVLAVVVPPRKSSLDYLIQESKDLIDKTNANST